MAWTYNKTRRYHTKKKGRNQQIETPYKYQNIKIISRRDTIFCKIYTQPFRENR